MVEHALAWAARGFRVFPAKVNGKSPAVEGWKEVATSDPGQIRSLWGDEAYNVGVWCVGLVVVDLDVKNGKNGIEEFDALCKKKGIDRPATLAVQSPSGGVHLYYSGPPVGQAGIGEGIDIRSIGGLVIAPGSEIDGVAYKLLKDAPVAPAPQELVSLCRAKRERSAVAKLYELDTDIAVTRATELCSELPPAVEGQRGNDKTYWVACRLIDEGLTEETCLDLMLEHYNPRCEPEWSDEQLAQIVESAFRNRQDPPGSKSVEAEFEGVQIEVPALPAPSPFSERWTWQKDAEDRDVNWLVYPWLPARGTALVVAPSGAGKTFFANTLARCLALGEEFFGVKPDEKVGAAILVAEGSGGYGMRLRALGENLPIIYSSSANLSEVAAVNQLAEDLPLIAAAMKAEYEVRLGVVVIDTLAASGLLDDENSNSDCAKAVKNLEQVARGCNCLVLVTHHPGKRGTEARGGSALLAGFDSEIQIEHPADSATRFVRCTKSRDGIAGTMGSFTLHQIVIGHDPLHNRDRTTCVLTMGREQKSLDASKTPVRWKEFWLAFEGAQVEKNPSAKEPVTYDAVRRLFGELTQKYYRKAAGVSEAMKPCVAYALGLDLLAETSVDGVRMFTDQRPQFGEQ